jgi:hypothetical protein
VRERKYLCEIIVAIPERQNGANPKCAVSDKTAEPNEIYLEISPILFLKNAPLLVEFIENKIRIEKKVYGAIKAGANRNKADMLKKSEDRIELLYELKKRSELDEYEDE